jgi:outer membrane protein OmpA-like peptidoglycan-associated protein
VSPSGSATDAGSRVADFEVADSSAGGSTLRRIPIPIQFEYRTATMTGEGQRAAALLLEYLTLTQPATVTLSGHADERGSKTLNMNLSRDRLQTVERYLRERGYGGEMVLLPKGESEPYAGSFRDGLSRDEAYQLDRRVELRLGG